MTEHLIDIASWNPVTDWEAVRADGITGASIKATQANSYVNPLALAQVRGARTAGVRTGGYHFGDPRVGVVAQADYFLRAAEALGVLDVGNLAPMYDVENWTEGGLVWQSPAQITDHVGGWLERLRAERGIRRAFIYGSESWWTNGWLLPDQFSVVGVDVINWIAKYNGQPGVTAPWADRRDGLHQHTSKGRVPGIPGDVDKNVTLSGRTLAELLIPGEGDGMAGTDEVLPLWKSERMFERILSQSAGVEGQNFDGDQFTHEEAWRQATTKQLAELIDLLQGGVPALVDLADRVDALERSGGATDVQVDAAVQRQFDRPDGPLSTVLRSDRAYGLVESRPPKPPAGGLSMPDGSAVPDDVAKAFDFTGEPAHAQRAADVPEQGRGGAE